MKWPFAKFEEVARPGKGSIVSGPFGSNIGSRFFVNEGVPVIRGNNLTFGERRFIDDGFVYLTEEKAREFKNCQAVAGDLVFTAAGTIGQVGIIPPDTRFDRYIISNKQLRVRCDPTKVHPLFLFLWFTTEYMRQYLINQNRGCSIPLINLGTLRNLPVPLPPLETQQTIADTLSAYDELMENNRRRMALLEDAARLLYQEWFVRLQFPGREHTRITKGVPEGWDKKRLDAVAQVNRATLPGSFDGEIEYVDIASVVPGQVTDTTNVEFRDAPSRARRVVQHGDIIWSCVRPNRRSHAVIWRSAENLIVSTGFAVITPTAAPSTFIYFATTTNEFVGYLENHARGAAYPAVLAADFERAELLIPPKRLLETFNELAEPTFSQIHNLRQQNTKLRAARDLLLPRLISGEIAV